MAYLCSSYPSVSHTFVLREVQALRSIGVEVHTFSVRQTPAAGLLSETDRQEAARTQHLLPTSAATMVRALARLLSHRRGPRALLAASRTAWLLRRAGVRGSVWQLFYLAEAVLMWDACSRRSVRHIHAHFANVSSDVALLTATLGSALDPETPWSWSFTMHGSAEFWAVAQHRLSEKASSACFVACISDFSRSQLMAWTEPPVWERLHVVHCGLDTATYGSSEPTDNAGGGARLVSVGRLAPVKGQVLIVDVIHRLRARGLEVSAEIIGEGPARSAIEQRIADYDLADAVTLPGALGQDRVPERLAGATALVLPSFAEGVPVVAMEAMALGVPVVATRVAGVPELIDDGVSGLLTTPGRVEEVVNAVERLVTDPELRARIVVAARETISRQFDVTQEARKLAVLFTGESLRDSYEDGGQR